MILPTSYPMTMMAPQPHRPTPMPLDPNAAWTAVQSRDRQRDGQFVYAVATTGVYCRPSCPSRRPHRHNVTFFETVEAAERAGFRPCRRCQPRDEMAPTAAIVERVRTFIDGHLDDRITLSKLARHLGLSAFHLQRTFKRMTGLTPAQYAAAQRAERFRHELKQGANVTRATYDAGYGSSSRLYAVSNAQLGMTPTTYRRGGRGMHIRYTTSASPFGRLLVAATDRGICAIQLGDDEASLEARLAVEYPLATRERAAGDLDAWIRMVLDRLDGGRVDTPTQVAASAPVSASAVAPVSAAAMTAAVAAGSTPMSASTPHGGAARASAAGAAFATSPVAAAGEATTAAAAAARDSGPSAGAAAGVMALDVHATEFKWRVWRALQEIPYGETRTYGEVAAAIGAPQAVRAVANACATNQAAIVIPCHRVIGANGSLTGYRWGVERKRRLLEHERATARAHAARGSRD